ncbi:MAG: hypothetical protein ACE14L_08655 [Terriglobales bacterium]
MVKDESGGNLAGVRVQGCTKTVCLTAATEPSGRFYISGFDVPVDVAVKIPEDETATPPRLEAVTPVRLVDDSVADAGTLYVPAMPAPVRLGVKSAQAVELSQDVALKLNSNDFVWPPTARRTDQLAARLLPSMHVPRFPELRGEEVVAVYAFFPFGTRSKSKIAVRLATTLPAGTSVRLRTVGELDGRLSSPEGATSNGRYIVSDPGTGITDLTWLVVSR